MEEKLYRHEPDYAVPPGATLAEMIEYLGITERELALRAVLPLPLIERIIAGNYEITPEIATKLESATSVPARLWMNMETNYRNRLAQLEERKRLLGAG